MTTLITRNAIPGQGLGLKGLETIMEYNGLFLNDRRFPDCFRVNDIGGLDDADVRDSRENNPGFHGETVFNAWYGGRTITLTGRIEGTSVNLLRDMQHAMRSAFSGLQEQPLYFRTQNVGAFYDAFSSSNALQSYTFLDGSGTITVGPGNQLTPNDTTLKRAVLSGRSVNQYKYESCEVYALFNQGGTLANGLGLIAKYLDSSNYIWALYSGGQITIYKTDGGVDSVMAGPVSTLDQKSVDVWLRLRVEGNVVSLEASPNPLKPWPIYETGSAGADIRYAYTMTGANATKFGTGVTGQVGFRWVPSNTASRIGFFGARPWNSTDFYINARKYQPVVVHESQPNLFPYRDFQISLRAANPRFLSAQKHSLTLSSGTVFDLDTWENDAQNLYLQPVEDAVIEGPGTITVSGTTAVTNAGNFFSEPTIQFRGDITTPALVNYSTGEAIILDTHIASGDYIDVDVARKTVKSKDGTNMFGALATGASWLTLAPGQNLLKVYYESQVNIAVRVFWNDAWI